MTGPIVFCLTSSCGGISPKIFPKIPGHSCVSLCFFLFCELPFDLFFKVRRMKDGFMLGLKTISEG